MTILDKFVAFAEGLPADRRLEIEEILESIMDSNDEEFELSAEELAELDRRIADPHPKFATPEEVAEVFERFGVK